MSYENTFEAQENKFTDNKYRHDDIVRPYGESDKMVYPHLILLCKRLEKFRVDALKGILSSVSSTVNEDFIAVYIQLNTSTVQVGKIARIRLKTLLDNKVFETFDKRIYIDEENYLDGDMLYAFCSIAE